MAAAGVIATDYVILKGPANAGWIHSLVSAAANSMVVRVCNLTGANANPNGFTMTFLAIH